MSEQEIPSSKAPSALGTFERLLLGMRSLMSFQMLQSGEGTLASGAYMRSWLVSLWWWEVVGSLGLPSAYLLHCCEGYQQLLWHNIHGIQQKGLAAVKLLEDWDSTYLYPRGQRWQQHCSR